MKIRTSDDLVWFVLILSFLTIPTITVSAILVPPLSGKILLAALMVAYVTVVTAMILKFKKIFMTNYINEYGIKNDFFGEEYCHMKWSDVNDWGIGTTKKGSKYIFISGTYLKKEIKRNILLGYDPTVCLVIPYTEEISEAVNEYSDGKISFE